MRGQDNRIRELRQAKGLSQRDLGRRVGTSQQQIQRLEAGVQAARIDMAFRIAKVLGEPFGAVFPGLGRTTADPTRIVRAVETADRAFAEAARKSGIDPDPRSWTVECYLRGGAEITCALSSEDMQGLQFALQDNAQDPTEPFFVWEGGASCHGLNLNHLLCGHVRCDREHGPGPFEVTEPSSLKLRVFMAGQSEPLAFDVDTDDDYEPESDADIPPLLYLTHQAQQGLTEHRFFHFTDLNGEDVWIRAADVALIEIPLEILHPKLMQAFDEDGSEGEKQP